MKSISKPSILASNVFLECISTVSDQTLKKNYSDCVTSIKEAEIDFDTKFPLLEIYKIQQRPNISSSIDTNSMKKVYTYRMVNPDMPGNKYYNMIKSSAPYGICPLCSVRDADTIDHYLPKSLYPIFSVTPINLVPACSTCNTGKKISFPKDSSEQTLHPYYDNIENESCIKAKITHTDPIAFKYYVECPIDWDDIKKERVENHFRAYNLNELYVSHASVEYRGTKNQLIKLFNNSPLLLKNHLQDSYESRLELGINSWQHAMYLCLFNDDWFLQGNAFQSI